MRDPGNEVGIVTSLLVCLSLVAHMLSSENLTFSRILSGHHLYACISVIRLKGTYMHH